MVDPSRRNPDAIGRRIRGIVFDMDGTLTVPCIDFAEMRRRVGIHEGDILHVIHSWPEDKQAEAFKKIAEIEEEALENLKVMPGAVELCQRLDDAGMPRALVTRNVMSSVDFFHETAFPLPPFHPSLSREWKPYKPDPASLHYIAEHWGVSSSELVMVGDSVKDDVVAGNRAGAVTILLDERKQYRGVDDETLPGRPDFIVHDLFEAAEVLSEHLDLRAKT
jgi:HAD superfamily hydrolase (TIGR01549 family)